MFERAIIDKIRSSSKAIEKSGKLPSFVLDHIYKEKLFKLFIPKQAGGKMLSLPDALHVFDEAGKIDGNLGWAITIGAGGGYFYAYMKTQTAHKVFKDRKALIAGSGHPTAIAEEVKGGYKVTGQWKYASGASYASAFTANAMIKSKKKILAFTFMSEQVSIIKDWSAFGMKATESHSFKVDEAFVPDDMSFDLTRKTPFVDAPIYQYPFLQFAETSFAALVIGIGRHFIEVAKVILAQNQKVWSIAESKRYKFVKAKLDSAEKMMEKTINTFYATIDRSWKQVIRDNKLLANLQDEVSKTS